MIFLKKNLSLYFNVILAGHLISDPAFAADISIDTSSTVTNAGQTINDGDSVVITEGTEIAPTPTDSYDFSIGHGINANAPTNITNNGIIRINKSIRYGIRIVYGNAVNNGTIETNESNSNGISTIRGDLINTGLISVNGYSSDAMISHEGNVTNEGTINSRSGRGSAMSVVTGGKLTNNGDITLNLNLPSSTPQYFSPFGTAMEIGDNGTIENNGTITTHRRSSSGFSALDNNTIKNTGTINIGIDGSAQYSFGVFMQNNNSLENDGTINVSSDYSYGVNAAGENNTLKNNGKIVTTHSGAIAVRLTNNNTLTNTGTISAENGQALVISGSGNTLDQQASGSIIGEIDVTGEDNYLNNAGEISSSNDGGTAVRLSDNNTLTNTGTISAENGKAIELTGSGNTLNLHTSGSIIGNIDFGTGNTLNIIGDEELNGPKNNAVFWSLADYDLSDLTTNFTNINGAAFSANNQAIISTDTRGFTSKYNAFDGLVHDVGSMITKRLNGYSEEQSKGVWVDTYYAQTTFEADANNFAQKVTNYGVALGFDQAVAEKFMLGGLIGANWNDAAADDVTASTINENSSDGYFGSIYGKAQFDNMFANISFTGGVNQHEDKRMINDLGLAAASVSADANYDSKWFSTRLGLGYKMDASDGWTFTPSGYVQYSKQMYDGYTEESISNGYATVADDSIEILESSVQIALSKATVYGDFSGHIGVRNRQQINANTIDVTIAESSVDITPDFDDINSAFIGGSADFKLGDAMRLKVGGEASISSKNKNFGINAAFKMSF